MTTKDDIATAIYDCHYGALSAFAKDRIDRLYREANKGMFQQAPQFQIVNVNEKDAATLQQELDALTDENAELWEENEQLKVANLEFQRRKPNANSDSWATGQQQEEFGEQSDSEV